MLYPDEDALRLFLRGLPISGIDAALDGFDLSGYAQSSADRWEEETGWFPFLAGDADEARYFDPPCDSRLLWLDGGLLSLASVKIGWQGDGTGTVQTLGRHFRALPQNAAARKKPITGIEWIYGQFYGLASQFGDGLTIGFGTQSNLGNGLPGSIEIVGRWGRQATLTDDVFQAVLRSAALLALPTLALHINGGLIERRAGDEMERYSDKNTLGGQSEWWQSLYDAAVTNYRRRELY